MDPTTQAWIDQEDAWLADTIRRHGWAQTGHVRRVGADRPRLRLLYEVGGRDRPSG
jgi:hypothetical protein